MCSALQPSVRSPPARVRARRRQGQYPAKCRQIRGSAGGTTVAETGHMRFIPNIALFVSALTTVVACGGESSDGGGSAPGPAEVPNAATTAPVTPPAAGTKVPAPIATQAPAEPVAEPPKEPPAVPLTRMYVADASGKLLAFALPLTASSKPITTIGAVAGLKSPRNVALSPGNDRVFVADPTAKKVFAFDLPITNASLPTLALNFETAYAPLGVAVDGAGNLWVSQFSGRLVRFDAPITTDSKAAVTLSTGDSANLYDVVVNPALNTVYTAGLNGIAAFIAPKDGDNPSFTIQPSVRYNALGLRADGSIFATEFASNSTVSFHPPLSAASQRVPRTTEGAGWGIRFQQDGTVLRTGLGGSAFEQSAAPKAMDLFSASEPGHRQEPRRERPARLRPGPVNASWARRKLQGRTRGSCARAG